MKVETFEIEEVTTEGREKAEVEAVAVELIREMGLEGQQRLLKADQDGDGDTVTRIPYPRMKADEHVVYATICNSTCSLGEYDGGIIPLRVLQVAAHARDLFEEIQVWAPAVHDPDPILVGKRTPPGRSYGQEYFLLARWGEVLEPFEKLQKKAEKMIREDWKARIETKVAEVKAFSAGIEGHVMKRMRGEHVYTPF